MAIVQTNIFLYDLKMNLHNQHIITITTHKSKIFRHLHCVDFSEVAFSSCKTYFFLPRVPQQSCYTLTLTWTDRKGTKLNINRGFGATMTFCFTFVNNDNRTTFPQVNTDIQQLLKLKLNTQKKYLIYQLFRKHSKQHFLLLYHFHV